MQGCPYHDKLLFCHSSLITLGPAPHLPLAVTRSIAWSVCSSVTYINPNTSLKELQLSSLGYFPSLRDKPLVIPMCPVVTRASRCSIHSYHSRPSSRLITSGFASWLHHLQSSGECNMSSAHSRSASLVSPAPALLSWCSVATISFPCGKGSSSRMAREGISSSGQLWRGVNNGICRGKGFSRRGCPSGSRGAGISSGIGGWIAILLASLHCSLHWAISPIICLLLFLRE